MITYQILGFVGSGMVILAYLPQTFHLLKEHCSAGISRYAYILWSVGSALLLAHALMIEDKVFIVLQTINTVFTGLILVFAERYKYRICSSHRQG
jgi:uncharacterized protein with PQ loop repeat